MKRNCSEQHLLKSFFLIKWKMWKFIIRRYNLCSKIWPFHLIINFYNFASKCTKFLYVTQNDWLSKISKFQSSVMKNADWLPDTDTELNDSMSPVDLLRLRGSRARAQNSTCFLAQSLTLLSPIIWKSKFKNFFHNLECWNFLGLLQ